MEKTDLVKLALMCAASGRHNIMLVGPAGCGKTIADLDGCDSVSEHEMDLACDLCKTIDIENINK